MFERILVIKANLVLDINRIGRGAGFLSISKICIEWEIGSWCSRFDLPMGQHYIVTKPVPILICPLILNGCKVAAIYFTTFKTLNQNKYRHWLPFYDNFSARQYILTVGHRV